MNYSYSPVFIWQDVRAANLAIILTVHNGLLTEIYCYANLKVAPPYQMKQKGLYRSKYIHFAKIWFDPKPIAFTFTADWIDGFAKVFITFTNSKEESLTDTAENDKKEKKQ